MSMNLIDCTLDDITQSDSGVQTLDSESSELMIESITSQIGFDFDDINKPWVTSTLISTLNDTTTTGMTSDMKTMQIDNNCNVTTTNINEPSEIMTKSQCSTLDPIENIVYRRKVRKESATSKTPKKRVSFHEDILKNTRTDNIHIEHGFITYKTAVQKLAQQHIGQPGRYSWCFDDGKGKESPLSLLAGHDDLNNTVIGTDGKIISRREILYRNACSDVLNYGDSDVFDLNDDNGLKYDNSGVFEYAQRKNFSEQLPNSDKCSCLSSNSSTDSDENKNSNHQHEYCQAKSRSFDYIENNNINNNFIGENYYYSEPNIELNSDILPRYKSVWNKEKKPKTSCLKKTHALNTQIIQENVPRHRLKKFNVHGMNQILDNSSKILFGSLKSIFTLPLPERGVPEGTEDIQSVMECVPEFEHIIKQKADNDSITATTSQITLTNSTFTEPMVKRDKEDTPFLRSKPFLSKSLDGAKQQTPTKKFIHNVDEQLRHKNNEYFLKENEITIQHKIDECDININEIPVKKRYEEGYKDYNIYSQKYTIEKLNCHSFRNKFIINCKSTVFEHTDVSCTYNKDTFNDTIYCNEMEAINFRDNNITPIAQPEPNQLRNIFMPSPISKTFSNLMRSFKGKLKNIPKDDVRKLDSVKQESLPIPKTINNLDPKSHLGVTDNVMEVPRFCSSTPTELNVQKHWNKVQTSPTTTTITDVSITSGISTGSSNYNKSFLDGNDCSQSDTDNVVKQTRHLSSPLKKQVKNEPYYYKTNTQRSQTNRKRIPDYCYADNLSNCDGVNLDVNQFDYKKTTLSEVSDEILTITTSDTEKNDGDLIIVNYPEDGDLNNSYFNTHANQLKSHQLSSKTSLINRFLRNVTQKKIIATSIKRNNFFTQKLKCEQKPLTRNLYIKVPKSLNPELSDDLNAEIAMEIEMSAAINSPRRELINLKNDLPDELSQFELGIGEISADIFIGVKLSIFQDPSEELQKVFKLYIGYSKEGYLIPVLIFLSNKALYVTDLVRNRLCSKFILAYKDLDVILMGPFGNTILLSNSTRNAQQVLLAGSYDTAADLIANLELYMRRSGCTLPAVGNLTLEHLKPLQKFVCENSSVPKYDIWMYYSVVNIPGLTLGTYTEDEPMGPHAKGFLMHRRTKEHMLNNKHISWNAGYFLLKAGVLYMFNDSTQKIPSWAMALAECQGARRATKCGRPYSFEIMLPDRIFLQLAAPDEYVASEWLQALLQSASGLFEMQRKHKILGCSLVITENHIITLRENFSTPLKQLKWNNTSMNKQNTALPSSIKLKDDSKHSLSDTTSLMSSTLSTPTHRILRMGSSVNSTPSKISQLSYSLHSNMNYPHIPPITSSSLLNNITPNETSRSTTPIVFSKHVGATTIDFHSDSSSKIMFSLYGQNSGLEILTCADIKVLIGIKIPSNDNNWWCILEFSCQEVRELSDDLILFFANSAEMQRFLCLLENLWQSKNNDLFPITLLDEDNSLAEQCNDLHMEINRLWEPLLSAALGYPL